MKTWHGWFGTLVVCTLLQSTPLSAGSPFSRLLPFKRIDADPRASYELQEQHGPWLILAASFAGEGAEKQAQELVLELRQRFHWPAYIHRQEYDFSRPVQGLTIDRFGDPARMRYSNAAHYQAFAVLVGDFASTSDPVLEKTLDKVKHARPDCLDLNKRKSTTQNFADLREWYRRINGNVEKRAKGPMGNAFVSRNPLLPASYFVSDGPDDFVLKMNRGVKYSLLDNPGAVTVRVATFRGTDTIDQKEIKELERDGKVTNKLEVAADHANRLTAALRHRGVEAYEYHDRIESIVTIGSFASEGKPLPDGSVEIDPGVLRIMQDYGASREPIPGKPLLGLQPRVLDGIPFDVQPLPMKVPKRSIGKEYARGLGLFR